MPSTPVDPHAGPRELQRGMAVLLRVAAVLVFLAGVQLFVFTERTDRYFAWTIQPALTAAFLGAAYWSSVSLEWMASRARTWAEARIAVPSVFVFTTLTLVATLIHLDKFHLGVEFELGTRLVTWAWLAIYTVVPVLMIVLAAVQLRTPGIDPPRSAPMPSWLLGIVAVQALILVPLGAALFLAPTSVSELWPWPLTELTGRAIGAWLFSLGLAAAQGLWERDARRVLPAAVAELFFAGLQAIALARYPDQVSWTDPSTIVYVLVLASMAVTGIATLQAARRRPGTAELSRARAAATV